MSGITFWMVALGVIGAAVALGFIWGYVVGYKALERKQ